MRFLLPLLCLAAVAGSLEGASIRQDDVVIDGTDTTIGLAATRFLSGDIIATFKEIIKIITAALSPDTPDEDIDYFALIKDNVKTVVGDYINEQNMDQIESYKDDLADLMTRYSEAPVQCDTYPDKNTMANSLSTAIIANRFLIEAVEWPHSMMLHYADIASIHIIVLQDAAETYSSNQTTSWWWVDLDNELAHYIQYGRTLQNTVVDWRNDLVECSFSKCVNQNSADNNVDICYDVWKIVDKVAKLTSECRVVSGGHECDDHCQAYQISMNRDVTKWVYYYLGHALDQWDDLKKVSADMADKAKHGN